MVHPSFANNVFGNMPGADDSNEPQRHKAKNITREPFSQKGFDQSIMSSAQACEGRPYLTATDGNAHQSGYTIDAMPLEDAWGGSGNGGKFSMVPFLAAHFVLKGQQALLSPWHTPQFSTDSGARTLSSARKLS